jgi:single-strand DNA-binding protein
MYLNKAIVVGNLTREVELKALPNGTAVANLSIATNRFFKDKDGNKGEQVEFHNVIVFGSQADNCGKFLVKGQEVLVEGRIQTRNYEKDGVKHYRTEIIADSVQFGSKPKSAEGTAQKQTSDNIDLDQIPF